MKKIIKVTNNLNKLLSNEELEFIDGLVQKLDNFNNVYLLTVRFINKINECSDIILKINGMDSLVKYHLFLNIGVKFLLIANEEQLDLKYVVSTFKLNLKGLETSINKTMIYDADAEKALYSNSFYMLLFILKILQINNIEGDQNEK